MSSERTPASGGAPSRLIAVLDHPVPLGIWLALILAASVVSTVPLVVAGIPAFARDWGIYAGGRDLWLATGSPYTIPPSGWDPTHVYPYLYPPTSWPLLLLAYLPWPVVMLGLIPIALTPPRVGPAIPAVALYMVAVAHAVYLNNVNVLIAGLIVLAFRPGAVGGLALGAASAVKAYTVALLPLLWGDRTRLAWTLGVLGALAVSGTVIFGVRSWADFLTALLREGAYPPDMVFNPLTALGPGRIVAAVALTAVGIAVGSPTLTLLGATWVSASTTIHYLLTFVAALCVEPPLRGRDLPARRLVGRLRAWVAPGTSPESTASLHDGPS